MILRILLVNLFEAELLVSSLPQAASASRPYLGLRMSEPLRGCYVGSYNRKEIVYHYSLRKATRGHTLRWICVSVIFVCSLLARPAQGAATTVDIRCLTDVCGRSNERPYG